jgi:hypothetical protein
MRKTKNYISILVIILTGLNAICQETDTLKCNIQVILSTHQEIEELTELQMTQFLKTFGEECKNNVEFSEFSNETLFNVVQSNPELFCISIEKNQNDIDIERVLDELKRPLHDLINLKLTKEIVEKTKFDTKLKQRIIESLNYAIGNE